MADGGHVPGVPAGPICVFSDPVQPLCGGDGAGGCDGAGSLVPGERNELLSGDAVRCGPSGQRRAGAAAAHPGRSGGGVRPLPLLPYGGSAGRDLLLLQPGGGPALPGVPALRGGGAGAGEGGAHPGGRRGRGEPVLCLLCPVAVLHGPDPANPNAGGQQSPHHLGPLAPTGGPDSAAYDAAGQPCFGGRHPHRPVLPSIILQNDPLFIFSSFS